MVNLRVLGGIEDPNEQIMVAQVDENSYAHLTRSKDEEGKMTIKVGSEISNVPQFSISANFQAEKTLTEDEKDEFLSGIRSITIPKDCTVARENALWLLTGTMHQRQANAA